MFRIRKTAATLAACALTLGLATATPAPANAARIEDGYYKLAYSDAIFHVDDSTTSIRPITFQEWADAGYPTPRTAPTDYVRYPWSPSITAVTYLDPDVPATAYWERLDYTAWSQAGYPAPRSVDHVPGSYYYKWATSSELFVEDASGLNHKLSYNEWASSGYQGTDNRNNEGFVKLSWAPEIGRLTNLAAGQGYAIRYTEWQEEAFPTPAVSARITGDQFYREYRNPVIWYAGPMFNRPVSFAEWTAAGRPAPTVHNVPANPGDAKDCRDFGSQAEAQAWFDYYFEAYGDIAGLDGNNDGRACESYHY